MAETGFPLFGALCATWKCSEEEAIRRLSMLSNPTTAVDVAPSRDLRFDPDFWPDMHLHVQRLRADAAGECPLKHVDMEGAVESLVATLATLSVDPSVRYDVVAYPYWSKDVDWRLARVDGLATSLLWMASSSGREIFIKGTV